MLYRVTLSVVMLAVILAIFTVFTGCANQQKDDLEQVSTDTEAALTVPTEEVNLNVTGMT